MAQVETFAPLTTEQVALGIKIPVDRGGLARSLSEAVLREFAQKYTPPTLEEVESSLPQRLNEMPSILWKVPYARKQEIIEGTSTWDATEAINSLIVEENGGSFDATAARGVCLSGPIINMRGTAIFGNGTVDDEGSRGTVFKLLPGSNCPIYQTDSAAYGLPATTYHKLQGVVFDCNGEEQTAGTPEGLVQMVGCFMGSVMRYVFIRRARGPALVTHSRSDSPVAAWGCDMPLDEVWINGTILDDPVTQRAFDTNRGLYATNPNGNYSANVGGLMEIRHLFVENTRDAADVFSVVDMEARKATITDPRNDLTKRKCIGIRFHNVESVAVAGRIHSEAHKKAIEVEGCRLAKLGVLTGAWITDNVTADDAHVSIRPGNQVVKWDMVHSFGGTPVSILPISHARKVTGYTSSDFADLATCLSGYPTSGGYAGILTSGGLQAVPERLGNLTKVTNVLQLEPTNGATAVLRLGSAQNSMASYGFQKQSGSSTIIGSNVNQSGGTEKTFLQINSNGNTNDSLVLSDQHKWGVRADGSGIGAGFMAWVGASAATQYPYVVTPGNLVGAFPVRTAGSGAPSGVVTPITGSGVHLYYDNTGNDLYCSTGTTNTSWKKLTP